MTRRRIYARIYGRVQGVAFRHYTRKEALKYALSGWVRNVRDGSVELQCEGYDEDVTLFLEWLNYGPPMAKVEQVDWREISQEKEDVFVELDFQVRATV